MSDLIERLRAQAEDFDTHAAVWLTDPRQVRSLLRAAADTIEALTDERDEARALLRIMEEGIG